MLFPFRSEAVASTLGAVTPGRAPPPSFAPRMRPWQPLSTGTRRRPCRPPTAVSTRKWSGSPQKMPPLLLRNRRVVRRRAPGTSAVRAGVRMRLASAGLRARGRLTVRWEPTGTSTQRRRAQPPTVVTQGRVMQDAHQRRALGDQQKQHVFASKATLTPSANLVCPELRHQFNTDLPRITAGARRLKPDYVHEAERSRGSCNLWSSCHSCSRPFVHRQLWVESHQRSITAPSPIRLLR